MSYVQGFVAAVPTANKANYVDFAGRIWAIFKDYGAVSTMEAWGDDIANGKLTDFKRAVEATADETVVLSWVIWPDKATCQAAQARMRTDTRMQPGPEMPFDGRRMIFGGFTPVFEG